MTSPTIDSSSARPAVAHLVVSLAHGGLERLVVDWTNARNRRWPGSTWVVCLDEPGDLAPQVEEGCVMCLQADRSRSPWDRAVVATLRAWLSEQSTVNSEQSDVVSGQSKEEKGLLAAVRSSTVHCSPFTVHSLPCVLHAHNLAAWQYAVLAARGTAVRTVHTQHGANTHNFRLRDRMRSRALAFLTDEIVAVSEATAATMTRLFWIPQSRINVIANGIDVGRFQGPGCRAQAAAREQEGTSNVQRPTPNVEGERAIRRRTRAALAIPEDAAVIGSVGRLAYVKGYDRLIQALFTVYCSPFTGYLLLVGDGPERRALEEQARLLGAADRVRFAGFQSDPAPYLAAMDAFVLPSRSEGVSISLLEAMAAGVPVFATDAGASREVIEDGACGTVLPAREQDWLGLIGAALAPGGRAAGLLGKARERVAQHYSLETTLDAYEALYQRSMGTTSH